MEDSVDRIIQQWAKVRPDIDTAPMGIVGRLSRLTRILERELQAVFSEFDLQRGEFDLLATLRRTDVEGTGLTAGELADSTMVTSGAITNRLDRLVAKNLVTRETDPNSRRTIRVALTPEGRRVIDKTLVQHVANEERLLAGLDPRERAQLEGLLRALLYSQENAN